MPYRISREKFQELADRAYDRLPARFRRKLGNMLIMVEDYPSDEDLDITGAERDELLGIFRGAGMHGRDSFFSVPPVFPDQIVLFQRNLEGICGSERELDEEIRKTLIHEIGHFFGFDEATLSMYGL